MATSRSRNPKGHAPTVSGALVEEVLPVTVRNTLRNALRNADNDSDRVDLEAFGAFFGPRLALYQHAEEGAAMLPTPSKSQRRLGELEATVRVLRRRISDDLPELNAVCWKRHGVFFDEYRDPLIKWLDEVGTMAALSLDSGTKQGSAGAKSSERRDRFLHDVAAWFRDSGLRKGLAAELASIVLRAVGVEAPAGREAEKVINRTATRLREI